MRVLDLFSGIGGFSLGLERAGMTTVAFCEIEPYAQKVLRKHWPDVPIFDDIRTLNAETLADATITSKVERDTGRMGRETKTQEGGEPETGRSSSESGSGCANGRTLNGNDFAIDLICGGFPCQP